MKKLTEKEIAFLILMFTFILGAWIRLLPATSAGFPLNDGGMFYTMIRDLRQNRYILPPFTTYNNLLIPFDYPPLAFYLAGILADVFHLPDLTILLWLPAIVNVLTLPAFALLAHTLLKKPIHAAVATFLYTLTPLSMDWFLMGGGLTRGLGQLFLLLTCWSAYQLFSTRSRRFLGISILFGALVVLVHPESAILTLTSVFAIWLFTQPNRRTLLDALIVALGVALLCAPWLVYVLKLHGLSPFLLVLQTNGSSNLMWTALFTFDFSQEFGLTLLGVLGLIGLFLKLGEKQFLLPAWLALPFLVDPRSSARAAIIPLSIMATMALLDIILPALQDLSTHTSARKISARIFLVFLALYFLLNAFLLDNKILANRLAPDDQKALEWISNNTSTNSTFLVLTGASNMMRDPLLEWFPALTDRNSQTTIQGLEWLLGNTLIDRLNGYSALQHCIQQDLNCLQSRSQSLHLTYNYIFIDRRPVDLCGDDSSCKVGNELIDNLRASNGYKLLFQNDNSSIWAVIQ